MAANIGIREGKIEIEMGRPAEELHLHRPGNYCAHVRLQYHPSPHTFPYVAPAAWCSVDFFFLQSQMRSGTSPIYMGFLLVHYTGLDCFRPIH
jgi:hypothetical protein